MKTLKNLPTLVIFCKRPMLYQGKQRLAFDIGAETALQIAHQLLYCALEDAQHWHGNVVLACAHQQDITWAKALIKSSITPPKAIQVIAQGEGNLGQRINFVDQLLRNQAHQQLVFIGTDAPILNVSHYQLTLDALKQNDIVLNHADDGGVVIMANNKPWPNLVTLPWSTELLSESLARHCKEQNLSVDYSKSGYDVDHIEDLQKLNIDLAHDKRPARQILYHTINALKVLPHRVLSRRKIDA